MEKKKVLIVDDEEHIRLLVCNIHSISYIRGNTYTRSVRGNVS